MKIVGWFVIHPSMPVTSPAVTKGAGPVVCKISITSNCILSIHTAPLIKYIAVLQKRHIDSHPSTELTMTMNLIRRGSKINAKKMDETVVNSQVSKILEDAQKQMAVILAAQEKEREMTLQTRLNEIEKEKNEALISLEKEKIARTLAENKVEEEVDARKRVEVERDSLIAAKTEVEKQRDATVAEKIVVEKKLAEEKEARTAVEKERNSLLSRKSEIEKGVIQLLGLNK